jgi:diguanylate cyclase (GGDEF)-like protein/PAS domain S-box-containing protein
MKLSDAYSDKLESYRLLVENVRDYAIYMLDRQGVVATWNVGAQRIKGYTADEIIGQHFSRFYTGQDNAAHLPDQELVVAEREGKWEGEGWRVRKDGSRFWASVVITSLWKEGNLVGFAKVTRDMTPQKEQQDALVKARDDCERLIEQRTLELHQRDDMLRSAFEQAAVAISYTPLEGFLREVNQKFCTLVGYSREELAALTFADITYSDDRAPAIDNVGRLLAGEADSFSMEKRLVRKDGGVVWINLTCSVVRDTQTDQPKQLISFAEDISWRKQAEKALAEKAALLDISTDAIFTTDLDGHILYWNRGAERMYGFTPEEAQGRLTYELLSTVFPEPRAQIRGTVIAKGYWEGQSVHARKDGSRITVLSRWTLERDDGGNPWRILLTNTDITERQQSQTELRRSEEQFRLLVEGTADYAIFLLDKDGHIVTWNAGAERILGYQKDEIIGSHFSRLYLPEDVEQGEPDRRLSEAVKRERIEEDRWRLRKDGKRFWATGVLSALYDEQGKPRGFVKIMRDNTRQRLADERIYYLANHDPLTGLANRTLFSVRLHEALAHAKRENNLVAVHMLDLDRFKLINDTLGHDVGDLLLKQVAQRILEHVRETDTVARLGGDEFVVIQRHLEKPEDTEVLAHKLVDQLLQPFGINGQDVRSGTSIGISIYPVDAAEPGELLKSADLALYRAKQRGRNGFARYSLDLAAEALTRQAREDQLRAAVREETFELYYQPQIDLDSWTIVGVEALLRWQPPGAQPILSLAELIELAEESGMIIPIGEWALREACRQNKEWQRAGISPFRIAVNVSLRELREQRFAGTVQSALQESDLVPSCLTLEVPQDLLGKAGKTFRPPLIELNKLGVRLSIDDFGANFAALSHLRNIGVDVVKIPHAVVSHLPGSQRHASIASAIIDLARKLNMQVMAEGVETEDQLAFLVDHRCSSAQGFLFSPPVPADELNKLLQEKNWARSWERIGKRVH